MRSNQKIRHYPRSITTTLFVLAIEVTGKEASGFTQFNGTNFQCVEELMQL